jgi:predicted methyltransferase
MRVSLLVTSALLFIAAAQGCHAQAPPATPAYVIPPGTPANVRRAVEAPDRTDEQRARDYHRKPAEILTMSGIKEGDKIVEIASFGQYFTTMLSAAVGPSGHVEMLDLPYTGKERAPPRARSSKSTRMPPIASRTTTRQRCRRTSIRSGWSSITTT